MALNPVDLTLKVALAPARLVGRIVSGVTGGEREAEAPPPPPKDLDDVAIARKVESVIFRSRAVPKGKVDVNVADGVVWLRGEVKTPDLVKRLEEQARRVPEVTGVENLLHLPKTPAPSRTDTPATQRKTRRTKPRSAAPRTTRGAVSDEAPPPRGAERSPRAAAATGKGRAPAPLGSEGEEERPAEADGPDTARLDDDPAYNPKSPGLRDLKGG